MRRVLQDAGRGLQAQTLDPRDALQAVMDNLKHQVPGSQYAWVAEASEIEKLPLPEELLRRPELNLSVLVTGYRSEDDPWMHWVLLLVARQLSVRT